MIRTRDAVIFAVVILVLCICIGITLVLNPKYALNEGSFLAYVEMGTTTSFSAEAPQETLDRQGIIERLRNALLHTESTVEPSPSVEEATLVESEEDNNELVGIEACPYNDTSIAERSWPLSSVSIVTANGVRTVVHAEMLASPVVVAASSTATTTVPVAATKQVPLLTMREVPVQASSPHCISGTIIGVTVQGTLMYNDEASLYRGYGPEYLIGYARDGYPIYGFYEGETDVCGGYMHASGYRYSVTPHKDVVLGCYSAIPSPFTNL